MVALAALDQPEYYRSVALQMDKDKRLLAEELSRRLGFTAFRSDANFLLVRFPEGQKEMLRTGLVESGITVKFFEEVGLADCMRITIGTSAQNSRLRRALDRILDSAGVATVTARIPSA
jgi:histidinol-phosphate aminotransferase